MNFTYPIDIILSGEVFVILLEFFILLVILDHIRRMRIEDKLLKENISQLKTLHIELHESMELLKEDIKDLQYNNQELDKFLKKVE